MAKHVDTCGSRIWANVLVLFDLDHPIQELIVFEQKVGNKTDKLNFQFWKQHKLSEPYNQSCFSVLSKFISSKHALVWIAPARPVVSMMMQVGNKGGEHGVVESRNQDLGSVNLQNQGILKIKSRESKYQNEDNQCFKYCIQCHAFKIESMKMSSLSAPTPSDAYFYKPWCEASTCIHSGRTP